MCDVDIVFVEGTGDSAVVYFDGVAVYADHADRAREWLVDEICSENIVMSKYVNGNYQWAYPSELQPPPEPTIEVPVGVAKAVAGAARTADEITTAVETLRRLIEKAGH